MADVNRGNRPLSPHISIYKPQFTSVTSILHRATGVGLTAGAVLAVVWLLGVASGPETFAAVDGFATSWIGNLVWIGSTWALAYHFCNGIRHLVWDAGYGYEIETAEKSAQAVGVGSVVLTALIWLLV